jgi:serine/threonine-protein kinase RsbW
VKKAEITLYRGFYPVDEVRNFITDICRQLGLKRKEAFKIKAAVDEACINIIEHSYKHKKGDINIRLDSDEEKIKILIKDSGKAFNIKDAKRKTPADIIDMQKEGGLGLSMIERLMDEVKYSRNKKHNKLIMVKYYGRKHKP